MEKHFYAGAYTSQGFVRLTEDALRGIQHLYLLEHYPDVGQYELLKALYEHIKTSGEEIWIFHTPLVREQIVGLVIPAYSFAMIDILYAPDLEGTAINLDDCWNLEWIQQNIEEITQLQGEMEEEEAQVLNHLAAARGFHHQREKTYVQSMDFTTADRIAEQLCGKIFQADTKKKEDPITYCFFFGAATPEGAVNYIEENTKNMKRYILHGRSGSGKSTLLKKVGRAGELAGHDVEYYHCSFDPSSIDMVVIPALNTAVLDGTTPHVILPDRETDEVIDLFVQCIDPTIETTAAKRLSRLHDQYRAQIILATEALQRVQAMALRIGELQSQGLQVQAYERWKEHWLKQLFLFFSAFE
ncbi:hypothetical protein [Rubeoparvulum massiliense]|uniref:hypothetical protein n=1 Tax=Rubeoparvulum massiliense TaxID=1631346 RepID=UPI00065DD89B|nr:hypothetical protein [Rubeoparvulum massiliense]